MTTMAQRSLLLFVLLFGAAAAARADQVTLKNGDRVTGSIVKKEGNNLTIKSELMGVVTIPWDQITEIKSAEPLNVVLAGQSGPKAPGAHGG